MNTTEENVVADQEVEAALSAAADSAVEALNSEAAVPRLQDMLIHIAQTRAAWVGDARDEIDTLEKELATIQSRIAGLHAQRFTWERELEAANMAVAILLDDAS